MRAGGSEIDGGDLRSMLKRHHIELIVEKVETGDNLGELLDFGIRYGQGYLFGEPRPSQVD